MMARGGGNVVGLLDRMLANPIPVLLELKDTLQLTAEQVARVQSISDSLQLKLDAQRDTLGRKIESASPEQQRQLFGEIQPAIEATRQQVRSALGEVQKVLTPAQWEQVPALVRDPFQRVERNRRDRN